MEFDIENIRVGIMFNAFVSGIVASIAFAFGIFLFRRWKKLDDSMRAYAWFWIMTMIVWASSSVRYLIVGLGFFNPGDAYYGSSIHYFDILLQGSIFFTGPPLFYYAGSRIFKNYRVAQALSALSFIIGIAALRFLIGENGITAPQFTYFSADSSITRYLFMVFTAQAAVILLMLLYDTANNLRLWWTTGGIRFRFFALYSLIIVIYTVLGSIDQSKIVIDWPLVLFRLLYSAAFLMAYITVTEHEASEEEYLIEEKKII